MLKKIQNPKSAFQRYFREADDQEDQVSVTVAPRKNRGTDYGDDTTRVTVAPRTNRGTDYGDTGEEPETDEEIVADDTNEPATDVDDEVDYTTDDEEVPEEPDTGGDGTDYGAEDEGETDDTTDAVDDQDAPAEPDGGEGTDYGDDNQENSETDGENEDTQPQETEEEKEEKLKKFHMYKRFKILYNTLDSFLEKIRDVVKNDSVQNTVIKKVTTNLNDLYDNMYDFMTIKYKEASYVQILVFFETSLSIIRLNFELLRNNKINLKQQ